MKDFVKRGNFRFSSGNNPAYLSGKVAEWYAGHIVYESVLAQKKLLSYCKSGVIEDLDSFKAEIASRGFLEVSNSEDEIFYFQKDSLSFLYLGCGIDFEDLDSQVEVSLATLDCDTYEWAKKQCDIFVKKTRQNVVSVVSSSRSGYKLTPIGKLNSPLNRDNYSESILKQYDYIVKELNKPDPFGRLVVVNGPPGTGKTYMLQGVINELKNSVVLLLPASLVGDIDGPRLINLFIEHKQDHGKDSMLIIIEDADACLATRMNDNIYSISSLLNHTDGIMGSLLNFKIIATTNQETLELDKALTRSGRLLQHVEVGALSAEHASAVFSRLTNKQKKYTKPTTLADIYADAKEDSEEAEVKVNKSDSNKTSSMGFKM